MCCYYGHLVTVTQSNYQAGYLSKRPSCWQTFNQALLAVLQRHFCQATISQKDDLYFLQITL